MAPSNIPCPPFSNMESDEYAASSYTTEGADVDSQNLLDRREQLTNDLAGSPYDLVLYLQRADVYTALCYFDLAAGDAYRALLLIDEVRNDGFEYHEQAVAALSSYLSSPDTLPEKLRCGPLSGGSPDMTNGHNPQGPRSEQELAATASVCGYFIMAKSLNLCGCYKGAYEYTQRGLSVSPNDQNLLHTRDQILMLARQNLGLSSVCSVGVDELPEFGKVRREIYPWNTYEPQRYSDETLAFLNNGLKSMAPKCAVQISHLPVLLDSASDTDGYAIIPTCNQLGLFATEDIAPGETVLNEYTLLTANNRLKDSICDACGTELPPLSSNSGSVSCSEGCDTVFCDEFCHDKAQELYHLAVCDTDVDSIAKDPDAKDVRESLNLLLLARLLAMSVHQDVHPLELNEVKYLWGDFLPSEINHISVALDAGPPPVWTLPFSLKNNIQTPLHILEKMDVDIFQTLVRYDLWVLNTCYAKFRGTASARLNYRNGRPEVAAVHPYWCLANHDCDPNVTWEWGGRMRLWAKERRVLGNKPGGIKAGQEILNHYCDVDLPVQERREWALSSLGGWCMCKRCRDESAEGQEPAMEGRVATLLAEKA